MGRNGGCRGAVGLLAVMVVLVACGRESGEPVTGASPGGQADEEQLGGEAATWELTGVSPDGGLLTLATSGGGCSEFQGWVSEEHDDRVHVEARWEHDHEADGCRAVLLGDALTLELDEPLGGRELTGCQRDDCRAEPDRPEDTTWGTTNQLSVDGDALVVTGQDTVWSLDPADGSVRWQQPREGYWSLAAGDVVLRYDHLDHIEAREAVSGEVSWEANDVTLADLQGDEVIVCPREQAMEDPPYESFRGALSLADGSWLWREEDADCTTGALDQPREDVPDIAPEPELIGHSAAIDIASGQDVVYVATSTALIALDPDTGDRHWWTPLAPAAAQSTNNMHPPTTEETEGR